MVIARRDEVLPETYDAGPVIALIRTRVGETDWESVVFVVRMRLGLTRRAAERRLRRVQRARSLRWERVDLLCCALGSHPVLVYGVDAWLGVTSDTIAS